VYLIKAENLLICNEKFELVKNKAFAFKETILEFDSLENLRVKYPNATLIKTAKNSLIIPAFINPHTHLEFSANAYTLAFGNFSIWLKSVLNNRVELNAGAKTDLILNVLKAMQKTGTATIGEISSFGSDLKACVQSGMRVIFFNEILGLNPNQNEEKKIEFLKRFKASLKEQNPLFIPAISIHSAYSTNSELCHFALNLAQKHKMLLSTHFLESKEENLYLRKSKGMFFKMFQQAPLHKIEDFIKLFEGQRTLFTHCVYLKELQWLDKNFHSITHCAFSNRLLSQKSFALKQALENGLNVHLGTDGLSSNISLSMLDEMRVNLLIHKDFDLLKLAKELLLMSTLYPARALGLNLGSLEVGKSADFSVFEIGQTEDEQLALQFILNAKEVKKLFIKGKECKF